MHPKKRSQMMAYLTRSGIKDQVKFASDIGKPVDKFEVQQIKLFNEFNTRNPRTGKAGGGMLVQPGFGGVRQGYRSDKFIRAQGSGQQKSEEMIKFLNYATKNKNTIKDKTITEIIEASGANVDKSNARKRLKENKIKIGTADKSTIQKTKQLTKEKPVFNGINNFAKNWINKNQKKYGVTEYDKFISDFANDWQKELNKPLYKNYTGDRILSNPDGTPKTNTLFGKQETGFTINDLKPPGERTSGLFYKRVFYKNKLKNKNFKKKVNNYLDWVLQDKRGKGDLGLQGGSKSNYLKAAQKVGLDIDKDVLYFFGEVMQGDLLTASEGFYSIVDKELGGNKASKYKNKLNISYQNWINNIEEVSKLAGVDPKVIINNQLKESKKMTELFGLKKLPFEFRYAQDHLFGLAEAKALGDPRIAKQTLTNLVASTKEQNTILGTKGFSAKRTALMRKFKNALPEEKINIINQLNTLSQEYVPDRLKYSLTKDDALRITNLQPEKTFKARTEAFEKLTKDFPKNVQNKLLQNIVSYSKKSECKVNLKADGGRIGFANSITCIQDGLKEQKLAAQQGNKKAAKELVQIGKVASRGALLKNLLGPGAILGEAVYEGAVIGNKVLGGKPADIAYAESYLSYLDPRKYRGELDPLKMAREDMLTREVEDAQGNIKTIAAPGSSILKSGFAAQDQLSAFNKAIEDRDLAKARGRIDQYIPAAAEAREQGARAGQSADIISSEAFKDASRVAQEYLQGQTGANMAKYRTDDFLTNLFQQEGEFESGRDRDLRRRRIQEMSNIMPRDFLTEKTSDLLDRTQALRELGYDVSTRDLMAQQEALRSIPLSQAAVMYSPEQVYCTQGEFAGGGIAKLAGVDSGPPPESGPNSQGLQGLMKRVRNF